MGTHGTAAAIADMILNPTDEAKRTAAIQALIEAPDDEYEVAINAFVFTYPAAESLRILLAGLRAANRRKGA